MQEVDLNYAVLCAQFLQGVSSATCYADVLAMAKASVRLSVCHTLQLHIKTTQARITKSSLSGP